MVVIDKSLKNSIWQQLEVASKQESSIKKLFANDIDRGNKFCTQSCGIYLDYSKQLLDDKSRNLLFKLAEASHLSKAIEHLMSGGVVNPTEKRPALHTALRLSPTDHFYLDGVDLNVAIQRSLDKVEAISEQVRNKVWRGFSGKSITDVVNIGVGGSDLGPLMVVRALRDLKERNAVELHFISNMDGTQLVQCLNSLNPETTLFIVSSKSFSTIDTFSNADTAIHWMHEVCPDKAKILRNHFLGVSASSQKMSAWGLPESNQLLFWEWVGGRFSMWSAIGLAVAIKFGMPVFRALLQGAHDMDLHFANEPLQTNIPVLLGLLGVWNSTFMGINAHTVLPYDGRLELFPNYLMQLEMESNGKSVDLEGNQLDFNTSPVMWGDVGSNAQHAFYQLLHQGTQKVSCDFIAPIKRYSSAKQVDVSLTRQHHVTLSNCLAQSRVLAFGNHALSSSHEKQIDENIKHKYYRGNQPSSTLLLDELTPQTLGALTAAYEHKVYVMSVLWNVNPFDQWGVEVGKKMATQLYDALVKQNYELDSSTNQLLKHIHDVWKQDLREGI